MVAQLAALLGGSGVVIRVPLRVPLKGSIDYRDSIKGIGFRVYYLEVQG